MAVMVWLLELLGAFFEIENFGVLLSFCFVLWSEERARHAHAMRHVLVLFVCQSARLSRASVSLICLSVTGPYVNSQSVNGWTVVWVFIRPSG